MKQNDEFSFEHGDQIINAKVTDVTKVEDAKREMAEKSIEIAKESISSGFDCLGCDKRDNLIFDEFILAIRAEAEKE